MKFLIAGLGNIGPEYALTRHNAGFMVLDRLAAQHGFSFSMTRLAYSAKWSTQRETVVFYKADHLHEPKRSGGSLLYEAGKHSR